MGNCVGSKGVKKDPKLLTEEEIKLLLDNTRLTRAQIVALHANFLKECPSGKLTKKDFVKLFKEVHPSENKKEKADKFCEYVFKVIDVQNLGYISFQDFVLCFSLTSDGDFRQKCEFAFKLYDLDKDGKISKKEMTQVLTALYDLSGIDDRKGDNAPAKKVDDIMRKINATYQPTPAPAPAPSTSTEPATAAAAPAASATPAPAEEKKTDKKSKEKEAKKEKETKKEKAPKEEKPKKEKPAKEEKPKKEKPVKEAKPAKEKAAKPAKAPEFITKDQFIDACNSDEVLKKLFVDSIFSNQSSEPTSLEAKINDIANTLTAELPSVSLTAPNLSRAAPKVTVNSSTVSNGPVSDVDTVVSTTTTVNLNDSQPPISVVTTTKVQPDIIEEEEAPRKEANNTNNEHSDHTHEAEHNESVNTNDGAHHYNIELTKDGLVIQDNKEQKDEKPQEQQQQENNQQ